MAKIYKIGNNIVIEEDGLKTMMIAFRDLKIEPELGRIFLKDLSSNRSRNYEYTEIQNFSGIPIGTFDETLEYLANFVGFKEAEGTALTTSVDTTNFNKNLTASETDVQKALDKIDDLTLGSPPAGSTTQIQYNKDGAFAGDISLTFDDTSDSLKIGENQSYVTSPISIKMGAPTALPLFSSGLIEKTNVNSSFFGEVSGVTKTGLVVYGNTGGANLKSIQPSNPDIKLGLPTNKFSQINVVDSFATNSYAELLRVASSGTNDASAIAEFVSTTKGILIPRMTTAQRNAIVTPATSLLIFNTDATTPQFEFWNGSAWVSFTYNIPQISVINKTFADSGYIAKNMETIIVDATDGDTTIFLPLASTSANFQIKIKKQDLSINKVIIDANGSDLIDDQSTYDLTINDQSVIIECNGIRWYIF